MSFKITLFLVLIVILSQFCSKSEALKADLNGTSLVVLQPPDSIKMGNYDLSLLERTTLFRDTPTVTILKRQDLLELSGLVCSRKYSGILYTHEDSGNYNEVYVTNTKGDDMGKIVLDGISNRDWEDLTCGPGPESSKSYLYVGEIGDNNAVYPTISVYRFPEPDLLSPSPQTIIHVVPEVLKLTYPKGAVNAESFMLDPLNKDLYILTKQVAQSNLFVARYPQSTTSTTNLILLASFPFDLLTSADISTDGGEILVRSTGQIWYWKRLANETVLNAMLRKPMDAPYFRNEHQGEAVCFAADGSGYFTTSETKKFPGELVALSFYKRK